MTGNQLLLIDKATIVAELERRKSELQSRIAELSTFESNTLGLFQEVDLYNDILSFLDTLETKEVDLEKELENLIEKEKAFVTDNREIKYYNGDSFNHIYELEFIAKHFYELGLKARKENKL
jgi:hypothetical protein